MRAIQNPKPIQIRPHEIEDWKRQGYVPLEAGDAGKANSDYFAIMVRDNQDGTRSVEIVCPSFLRGPLGFTAKGCVSY